MNPFAAVYGFWMGIPPPIREPVKSWVVSNGYVSWSVIVYAVASGAMSASFHNFPTFGEWLVSQAFPFFMAIVFGVGPLVRAKQAQERLANTVSLDNGVTAVINRPPGGTPL
jgi:hypothetical protein